MKRAHISSIQFPSLATQGINAFTAMALCTFLHGLTEHVASVEDYKSVIEAILAAQSLPTIEWGPSITAAGRANMTGYYNDIVGLDKGFIIKTAFFFAFIKSPHYYMEYIVKKACELKLYPQQEILAILEEVNTDQYKLCHILTSLQKHVNIMPLNHNDNNVDIEGFAARHTEAHNTTCKNVAVNFMVLLGDAAKDLCHRSIKFTHFAYCIPNMREIAIAADITFTGVEQAKEDSQIYICDAQVQIAAGKIARELYVPNYISYFIVCRSALSSWHPNSKLGLPDELILKIMSFIDSINWPSQVIAAGPIHSSPKLRMGGELHNLMITTAISVRYPDAKLEPSMQDSKRWECVTAAIKHEIAKQQNNQGIG